MQELLGRHPDVKSGNGSLCAVWQESFDDAEAKEECLDPSLIKQAQSSCGEVLWLSVRARPEISFPAARMAQLTTRRVWVLKYLKSALTSGMLFGVAPTSMSRKYHIICVFYFLGPCRGCACQGHIVCRFLARPKTESPQLISSRAQSRPNIDHASLKVIWRLAML